MSQKANKANLCSQGQRSYTVSVPYIAALAFLPVVLLYITVDFATAASQNGDGKTQQMLSVYNDPVS